ncbi:NAD(P)/FAD-dependent oxidoreductase [Methylobacterium sp. ID0610]|uniref:NAD(P)/FAD-dependent oxidoreductase n=1 Tax=Methylobacterium carpenticola TaxID=3344827 RepID=UPI0036B1CD6F
MGSSADSHRRSLWSATAGEAPLDAAPLAGEARIDLAVIGGGITGCTAALTAAEAGASVILLEGRTIGWGASGRNGGQVIPGLKYDPSEMRAKYGEEAGRRLTAAAGAAAGTVFDRIAKHAIACDAKREGWIQAAHAAPALARVHQRAQDWEAEGAPVERLDAAGVARLTGARGYVGGWIDRRAGTLQPLAYTRGLARAAREAGAALHETTPVERLEPDGGGWRIATPGGTVHARRVIVGTDAYSTPLVPGFTEAMLLVQSVQIATEPLPERILARLLPEGRCCSETRRLAFYFRRSPDGRLLFGGRGAIGDAENPVFRRALVAAMHRIFPDTAGVPVAASWSGQVGLTLDGLPRVQEPAPNLHLGYGYNGRGVAMATVMGGWLARKALHGEAPPLPATPLNPIRWHRLRRPALSAGIAWAWLRDRVGLAG